MLVSVIVPIYNTALYLRECLESIVNQTYKNLDIILVDDGSNDESLQIALEFAQRDERIFVISKLNGGQSSARNFGLEFMRGTMLRSWAEGDWNSDLKSWDSTHSFEKREKRIAQEILEQSFCLCKKNYVKANLSDIGGFLTQTLPENFVHFVDSDDYLMLDSIERLVKKAIQEKLDICAYNLKRFFQKQNHMETNHNFDIPNHLKAYKYERAIDAVVESGEYSFVFAVQGIFKASLLNLYNLRFAYGIYGEDNDFGVILFALSQRFAYLDYAGIVYRIHDCSSTSEVGSVIPSQIPLYLEVLRNRFEDYRLLRRYFHTYCVCVSGSKIDRFFRDALRQNKIPREQKYVDFFEHSLAWHFDLCRVSLKHDPLGILEIIAQSEVKMKFLIFYTLRQIVRHPKKIKNILNFLYLLKIKLQTRIP